MDARHKYKLVSKYRTVLRPATKNLYWIRSLANFSMVPFRIFKFEVGMTQTRLFTYKDGRGGLGIDSVVKQLSELITYE